MPQKLYRVTPTCRERLTVWLEAHGKSLEPREFFVGLLVSIETEVEDALRKQKLRLLESMKKPSRN